MTDRSVIRFGLMALGFLLMAAMTLVSTGAQGQTLGKQEFVRNCASCHGAGGRGNGPLAKFMTVGPADLTELTARNDGEFPLYTVVQIIDGRDMKDAHGSRAMPIWGDRFNVEAGETFGAYGAEVNIRARILELIHYIRSLQTP
jgi:mono/diheme cytochrome c family protein